MKTTAPSAVDLNERFVLYRAYLAADEAASRCARLGVAVHDVRFRFDGTPEFFRDYQETEEARGETPSYFRYADVQLELDSTMPRSAQNWGTFAETAEEKQAAREDFIRRFLEAFPDSLATRYEGTSYLYFENRGLGVSIKVGQALCERVLLEVVEEEVPDPEIVQNVPKKTVKREVYGWRCNDAEFGGSSE